MLLDGWHLLGEAAAAQRRRREDRDLRSADGERTDHRRSLAARAARTSSRCRASVLNALSPVNSPTGVVASARIPSVDAACGADAGAGARAGRGRAAGSRQRRRDHSLGRRRRRDRRRARRARPRIRGDGRRCARRWAARFTCRSCAAARSATLIDEWRRGRRAHRRHGAARRHVDVRRRLHEADGGAARRRRRRPARRSCSTPPTRASAFPCTAAIESLNAAVAAAVLFYEAQRQRTLAAEGPQGR